MLDVVDGQEAPESAELFISDLMKQPSKCQNRLDHSKASLLMEENHDGVARLPADII